MLRRACVIGAVAVGCGCAGGGRSRAELATLPPAFTGACRPTTAVPERATPAPDLLQDVLELEGRPVVAIDVVGAPTSEPALRAALSLRPGDPFDREAVAAELRRLWYVGLVDDVGARVVPDSSGLRVELVVRERALVASVQIVGSRAPIAAGRLRRLRALEGAIDDPERTHRTAARLEEELRSLGHWRARVTAARRPLAGDRAAVCVAVDAGPRYRLAAIEFPGAKALAPGALAKLVRQDDGKINARGGAYRADLLDVDLPRVTAAYYDAGYVTVRVGRPTAIVDDKRARITVTVPITEGVRYRVGPIRWKGIPAALEREYRALLGVASGDVFSRKRLVDGIAKVRAAEAARGRLVDVIPVTAMDTKTATIGLTLEASP